MVTEGLRELIAELETELKRIALINTVDNRKRVVPELTVWMWLEKATAALAEAGRQEGEPLTTNEPAAAKCLCGIWRGEGWRWEHRCEIHGDSAKGEASRPQEPTTFGGSCGTTPFYLMPGQGSPEYDQGHSVIVWYDDLYNLAERASKVEASRLASPPATTPTCGEHGPMDLVYAQHRCRTCGWRSAR